MLNDPSSALHDHSVAARPLVDKLLHEQPISVASPSGLVSILIPCCGQLEYTRLCIPSVLRYSRKPFELIFLDIGSLDGTREFIAGIAAAAGVRVEVVRTPTDLGVADAVQEAVELARGGWTRSIFTGYANRPVYELAAAYWPTIHRQGDFESRHGSLHAPGGQLESSACLHHRCCD